MFNSPTSLVQVTPNELITLKKAKILYEGIAAERLKIYDQENHKWLEPDKAVARDHAERLKSLIEQVEK